MIKKSSEFRSRLSPLDQLPSFQSTESLFKGISNKTTGVLYLSGDSLNSLLKKDQSKKKKLLKHRKTRDISHLKDKLKLKQSLPLILPTDFNHLKALANSPTITGLPSTYKSCPMICKHRECVERMISSPANPEKPDFFADQTRPAPMEREFLGSPSGLQDIESLYSWFYLMKKKCTTDEEAEVIYTICSKELIRQVTVHCTLRGKLLKEILKNQPRIYSQKLVKADLKFEKFRKKQADLERKNLIEHEESMKKMKDNMEMLENRLKKSENIKNGIEDSLLQYRIGFLDLQRKCFHEENMWREKAQKYLKELNRIRSVVYVGTDKLAKFFAREDLKEIKSDTDLMELVKTCNEKIPELDLMCGGVDEHHIEIFNLFKKFIDGENIVAEVKVQEKNEISESIDSYTSEEHEKLMKINEATNKEKQSYKIKVNFGQALKNSIESYKSLDDSGEYIKISDEKTVSDNQISVEHHYTFTEEDDQVEEEEGKYDTELISISMSKVNTIEINEADSHLEESRLSNIEYEKEENPLEKIELHESIQLISVSVQTEELYLSNYLKKFEKIDEILIKANSLEAQITIEAISSIINQHKQDIESNGDNSFNKIQKCSTLELIPCVEDLPNRKLRDSQGRIQDLKQSLMDLVDSAAILAAKCELQKEEIEELNEQLEIKATVLHQITEKGLNKMSSKADSHLIDGFSKSPITKKMTLALEGENNNWTEGYETGLEEGKIQGYLLLVERIKNNIKCKDVLNNSLLQKSGSEKNTVLRRKATKSSTKFSEFNFHVAIRSPEKKKTSPVLPILEKFFQLPLNKIKLKSTVSRKNVNKTLIIIYSEAFSRLNSEGSVNLIEVTFDEFLSKYSIKTASEKKFLEFMASVVSSSEYKRSSMYLRLISYGHLISASHYSKYSVSFYIVCTHFLYNSKIGIFIGNEEDDKIMIPVIRVNECMKEKLEHYNDRSLMQEIFREIEKCSQPDPKKINAGGVIELELIMETVLDKYESYCQSFIKGVSICFKALGYESIGIVSWIDIQIVFRFFGKAYKEFVKDVGVDEFIVYCIKANVCHEDEVLKAFEDTEETFSSVFDYIKVAINQSHFVAKSKSITCENWTNRLSVLESLSIEDPDLAVIGSILYKSEIDRILLE